MPDRLGDFLDNTEPSRNNMVCPKCGEVIKGNTAIAVRFAMRRHRKKCPFKNGKQEEVTDPPDPRDPDNVGDPEEFDAELARELAEFLESEQLGELSDDMLLDRVGRQDDNRTIYDDLPESEEDLQDAMHDVVDEVLDIPIPKLLSTDEAMKIIAEANKKREEKEAAERRAQSQGEENVPISDDAQRIANIGSDETAAAAVNEAKADLDTAMAALQQAGGAITAAMEKLGVAAEKTGSQSAEAGGLLGGSEGESISSQGQTVSQQVSNSMQHIQQVDVPDVTSALQQANLDGVLGQIQELYSSIREAAARHGQ